MGCNSQNYTQQNDVNAEISYGSQLEQKKTPLNIVRSKKYVERYIKL
jgi:hypothetical protein